MEVRENAAQNASCANPQWKMDPEHRLAQAMGRDKWYQFVTVCPANYRKTENPVNQWKL